MTLPLAAYLFGAAAMTIVYVLFGYPCVLAVLSRRERKVRKQWTARSVSIVMPVHNGERWMAEKLESIRQLDYPADLLQVLVVDDGSTDRTREIAAGARLGSVEIIPLTRSGKAVALNAGIERATGEILLLTDIRQRLSRDSLRRLVTCFADDRVGVASGELIILSGETQQEADIGLYWRYEKWIRRRLSRIDSVLGATGCLYAMRRELAVSLPPDTLLDDVYLPLGAFFKGYRIVFEESANAFDYPTALDSEFRRKVRTQAGVYQIVRFFPRLLLPKTRMWFHFCSHKLGRLALPWALVLMAIVTLFLPAPWKQLALLGQVAVYGAAAIDSWIPSTWRLKRVSSIARTFVVLMAAAFWAPFYLLTRPSGGSGWGATEVRPAVSTRADRAR